MKLKFLTLAAAIMVSTSVNAADTSKYEKAKDAVCKVSAKYVNALFDGIEVGVTKRQAQDLVIKHADSRSMTELMVIVEKAYRPDAERSDVEFEVVMECLEAKQAIVKAFSR